MRLAQRWNRLTTSFWESTSVVKRRTYVYCLNKFYVFYTVHRNIIIQYKPIKQTFIKLRIITFFTVSSTECVCTQYFLPTTGTASTSNPIPGLDRPWAFLEVETPRFQDNRKHEDDKYVIPTHRPPLPPRKYSWYSFLLGHAVAQLVEAVSYEPESRGFDSRWCHWNCSLP
jgi:hypothetical protein